jgi:hypothetical protein
MMRQNIHVLASELRALRHSSHTVASGAHVHRLSTLITNITMALYLFDTFTTDDQREAIPAILRLVVPSV